MTVIDQSESTATEGIHKTLQEEWLGKDTRGRGGGGGVLLDDSTTSEHIMETYQI